VIFFHSYFTFTVSRKYNLFQFPSIAYFNPPTFTCVVVAVVVNYPIYYSVVFV